jgi:hypothetical protein
MPLIVTDLYRYPVKSCRGEPLADIPVEPWGLAGDRRWMVVDPGGEVVTARDFPRLLLVTPYLEDGAIRLTGPGLPDLIVPVPDGSDLMPVKVWDSKLMASLAGLPADRWFSKHVGYVVRLVYLDDPTRRPVNPGYGRRDDRVSFADGYPLLLTAERSLRELNGLIAVGARRTEGPLPMIRFRPSVVVAGSAAWEEDAWRRVRIGNVVFRAVKGCDRCVMTTMDPDTATRGMEPIATLARYRRWDGKVWFGTNLIPDLPADGTRPSIHVGDPVEVLEQAESAAGPLR